MRSPTDPVRSVAPLAARAALLLGLAAVASAQVVEVIDPSGDGAGNLLQQPERLALDDAGNLYVTGAVSRNVLERTPAGVVTEILDQASSGLPVFIPGPIAVDGAGNVYVAHLGNPFTGDAGVVKRTPGGVVTTLLDETGDGAGHAPFTIDDLALDAAGNLYVTSSSSIFPGFDYLFRITPDGEIDVLLDETGDGQGATAVGIAGVVVEPDGTAWVTARTSGRVFEVEPDGTVTSIVDANDVVPAVAATFFPISIARDDFGNLFVYSQDGGFLTGGSVLRIPPSGGVDLLLEQIGPGQGLVSRLATDASGTLYVAIDVKSDVYEVTPDGVVHQILDVTGDGAGAGFGGGSDVLADEAGFVYVAGSASDNVFKVGPLASCTFRNGSGMNPADFTCSTEPVLGETWQTLIDPASSVGDETLATVLVLAFGGPIQGFFAPEGELLVLPPFRAFASADGALGQHAIPIPADPAYAGLKLHAQGVRLEVVEGGQLVGVLLNAQDPLLGF